MGVAAGLDFLVKSFVLYHIFYNFAKIQLIIAFYDGYYCSFQPSYVYHA